MRWLYRVGVALVVVVVIAGLTAVWMVRRPFPQTDGTVEVSSLDGPVEIIRDVDGVPHIYASTSHDLFFAQGYAHAQDRFWQMDFWRHLSSARLSELFGESQVETDAFLRTLGFRDLAEQSYRNLPTESQALLDAYAAGVNAYLGERSGGSLALEYTVLSLQNRGYQPEPWTPADSLGWTYMMAWDLKANMEQELYRAHVSASLGVERTEELFPPYPVANGVIVSTSPVAEARAASSPIPGTEEVLAEVRERLSALPAGIGGVGADIGSNNWVIAGSRTASGKPLLANDPHLGIQMPSIWHEVSLHCEPRGDECPFSVQGFSFAGVPGVVIGHNDRIAWGVTNLGPDSQDIVVERLHPDDPYRYEVDGEWMDMEVRTETIEVAGGDPVEIEVLTTRNGPVISGRFGAADELAEAGVDLPDPYAVSLRWANLRPSTLFEALLGINLASNWEEFRAAAASWDVAAQNLVYADVDGHIGYQATGVTPVRSNGDGRYPVPGWTTDNDWEGFIPFEELPYLFDPPEGYIVTANQPVVDGGFPYFLHVDTAYGFRAARIEQLIAQSDGPLEVGDMQSIQMDSYDASAEILVPWLLDVSTDDDGAAALQEILEGWGSGDAPFRMDADSSGAAAYGATWRHVLSSTFDDELPERYLADGGGRYFEVVRRLLERPDDPWWDDTGTPEVEDRDEILRRSLASAHDELTELLGDDSGAWKWGELHVPSFESGSFGQSGIGPIEWLFNRTGPGVSGGSEIVNATGWVASDGYGVTAVPSLRMVVDLADFERSRSMHTTGQSGHPFHRWFDSMIEPWATGWYHPMRWERSVVEEEADGRLTLIPAP